MANTILPVVIRAAKGLARRRMTRGYSIHSAPSRHIEVVRASVAAGARSAADTAAQKRRNAAHTSEASGTLVLRCCSDGESRQQVCEGSIVWRPLGLILVPMRLATASAVSAATLAEETRKMDQSIDARVPRCFVEKATRGAALGDKIGRRQCRHI